MIGDRLTDPVVAPIIDALSEHPDYSLSRHGQADLAALVGSPPVAQCVLLIVDDAGDPADLLYARLIPALAPAPVIVIAEGVGAAESVWLAAGVDDCLDPAMIGIPVVLRVVNRSIERASQRVHVNTAQKQYRDLFDHMPVAAFSVDIDGRIIDCNRAFLSFMAADSAERVSDDQLNGLLTGLSRLQQATGGAAPAYRDTHIIDTLNGEQNHVVVYARQNSERSAMDVYLTDITEQEMQTRRVSAAENKLRQLYDNVPVMMFTLDDGHCLRDVNRTFAEKVGLTAQALEGLAFSNLLHPDFSASALTDSLRRVFSGGSTSDLPVELLKPDGVRMECLFSGSPLLDATGGVCGAYAMLVDVTDRNDAQRERDQLQEQLQLTQKLESIGELAAGIAHEINTPAQYVSDNLSFLLESFVDLRAVLDSLPEVTTKVATLADGAPIAEALKAALDDADLEYLMEEIPTSLEQGKDGIAKIREIVLALKDFSHPGSGDAELADLNRIIDSTVTVARNEWKYVANIDFDLAENLPLVECFPSAIAQVILNIVVNAAHAISDARADGDDSLGNIRIASVQTSDNEVEFSISDDGPGIPEDIQRKVFDPFFTTKEVGRGTGQGLAISRTVITDQHQGAIALDSNPERGTTFRISLPIRRKKSNGLSEEAA